MLKVALVVLFLASLGALSAAAAAIPAPANVVEAGL